MKTINFDSLIYLLGMCWLLVGAAALPLRGLSRAAAGFGGMAAAGFALWVADQGPSLGGFGDVADGGYVGARLTATIALPFASVGLELDAVGSLLLAGVAVITGASLVGLAAMGATRAALVSATALQAALITQVMLPRLDHMAAAAAVVAVVATLCPLWTLGARPAGRAALRAFAVHRVGDAALLVGLAALGTSLGDVSPQAILLHPLDIEPWARVAGGLFDGYAHRTLWFVAASGVAVGVATRLGVLCWPLLRDLTASSDLPAPLAGAIHGALQASGAIILVRCLPVLALSPEAGDGFVWAAVVGGVVAGALSCAGRDLLRLDTHLLAGAAAPLVLLSALGSLNGAVMAGLLAMALGLVLPWTVAALVSATQERDPVKMAGLEGVFPRLHSARLLSTASLALVPPLAGWVVVEKAVELASVTTSVHPALVGLLVASALLTGCGAWRALHLVFSGKKPPPSDAGADARTDDDRGASAGLHGGRGGDELRSSKPLNASPSLGVVLPMLLVAFMTPAIALLELPQLLLRLLPVAIEYDGPLQTLFAPIHAEILPVVSLYFRAQSAPDIAPSLFIRLALLGGVLPWAISMVMWRRRGDKGPPGGALLRTPMVSAVAARLATMAGQESPLARSVSEGAERLSRVLATNVVPFVLSTAFQRLPGLLSWCLAMGGRALQAGGAQRALVLSCLWLAWLLWLVKSP
jgi:NADH:ubiquinone oxidoreductase subunit 5 (subunit L)/multisubunit Na+/H+ antiporter MnhA subunit